MTPLHPTPKDRLSRNRKRGMLVVIRSLVFMAFLWPALAWPADKVVNDPQLAIIDSLITAGSATEAFDLINAALKQPDLNDTLRVEYGIRKLIVLRYVDQWNILVLESDKLLRSSALDTNALVRIRLLRAVAFENMDLYPSSRKELDQLRLLFGQRPTGRSYGEYLYRVASFHRVQGERDLAIQWAQKAIDYNEHGGYTKELASSYLVMGASVPQRELSIRYLERSATLNMEAHDLIEASAMYGALAAKVVKDDPRQARKYLHKALTLIRNGGPVYQSVINKQASDVYNGLGELDSALIRLQAYLALHDSVALIKQGVGLRVIDEQHSQEQLGQARAANVTAARTTRRLKWLTIALATALASILALSILLGYQLRKIRRQRNQLRERQEQLRTLLADKEMLLQELHHRVKNQLTTVIALIEHQLADKDSLSKEELQGVQQRIHAIARVHEKLLNRIGEHSRLNSNDLQDVIHSLTTISGQPVEVRMEVDLPDLTIDLAVPLMMILNELITNSIKHGNTSAIVLRIDLAMEDGYVVLRYADNGGWKEPVTENREGGTGSYIIDAMVRQLHGDLERTGTAYIIRMRSDKQRAK